MVGHRQARCVSAQTRVDMCAGVPSPFPLCPSTSHPSLCFTQAVHPGRVGADAAGAAVLVCGVAGHVGLYLRQRQCGSADRQPHRLLCGRRVLHRARADGALEQAVRVTLSHYVLHTYICLQVKPAEVCCSNYAETGGGEGKGGREGVLSYHFHVYWDVCASSRGGIIVTGRHDVSEYF